MDILSSIILGIVEGLTEFLPISSTAHLIIASKLLGFSNTPFLKTFEIAIQSGAILAVLLIFWKKFLNLEILKRIIVAFIPTAIIGLLFYRIVKDYLLGNLAVVLWALAIGGVLLIMFEKFFKWRNVEVTDLQNMSYKTSVFIGVAQAIAIIPGVSRSAATIIGGMLLGVSRQAIVEFSFLLAVPTIIAATGFDLIKNWGSFSSAQFGSLSIGFLVSFISAIFGVKFLLSYIQKHNFTAFGVYRIVLVLFFLIFLVPLTSGVSTTNVYKNSEYGFELKYDKGLEPTSDFSSNYRLASMWRAEAGPGESGVEVVAIPVFRIDQGGIATGKPYPLHYSAEIRVGVSSSTEVLADCLKPDPSYNSMPVSDVVLNGVTFKRFEFSNAAMMQYIKGVSYRTIHNNLCYAVEQVEFGSSYRDETMKPGISDETLASYFNKAGIIAETFKFTK